MRTAVKRWLLHAVVAAGWVCVAPLAAAQGFNSGLPAGWTCVGSCGTLGADGDVTLSGIAGSTAYGWVSSTDSTQNAKLLTPFDNVGGFTGGGIGEETNGSMLRSTSFTAAAGDPLNFKFNYVTSDGTTDYIEYAWAVVRNASDDSVAALLFTGRTNPSGPPVPGFGLPSASATVNGGVPVVMNADPPDWSPLGGSSGECFVDTTQGCGFTGWIDSTYTFGAGGAFYLEFGALNWGDEAFDSGLAFDGITVAGKPIDPPPPPPIPEPSTYALMLAGLAVVGWMARRRRAD
jgi:hypothetical protein